jgi:hypothetical protein
MLTTCVRGWANDLSGLRRLFIRKGAVATEGAQRLIRIIKSNAQHHEDCDEHRPFQPV